jgi:hypothetical protein
MIRLSLLRLLLAGALMASSLLFYSPGGNNGLAVLLVVVGGGWGLIELFIFSFLLMAYGITGIVHDVGAMNERDPWHRW